MKTSYLIAAFILGLAIAGNPRSQGAAASAGQSNVEVYPGPDASLESARYAVIVTDAAGQRHPSFVYRSRNNFPDHKSFPSNNFAARFNHWTSFSFSGKVTVEVIRLQSEPITNCVIRPKSLRLTPRLAGNKVQFILDRPCQISVEINEKENWIEEPMLVFANPPESNRPILEGPNVINVARQKMPVSASGKADKPRIFYFPPGRHNLVRDHNIPLRPGFRLHSGDTVYLAGGAYVVGAFRSQPDATNITIRGRGILSGLGEPWVKSKFQPLNPDATISFSYGQCAEHLVELRGSNHWVEGITFADPTHFNLNIGDYSRVQNVKCFGWYYSTDGIGLGRGSIAEDCFLKVNDDAFKLYYSGSRVSRCVIWQQQNGAPFQFSWGHRGVEKDFLVRDCDLIHVEHCQTANNRAVFNCVKLENATMRDFLFENLRIEGDVFRLVDWRVDKGGVIENVFFRNLTLEGRVTEGNYFRVQGGTVRNIRFENLRIGGKSIGSLAEAGFQTTGDVQNIEFKK